MTLFVLAIHLLASQSGTPWRDPSPHQVRFVAVEPGVRLEVLDWGGVGRPIVSDRFVGRFMHETALLFRRNAARQR
jgi:hypothetical protein